MSLPKKPKRPGADANDAADRQRERAAAKAGYQGAASVSGALPDDVKRRIRDRARRERDEAKSHYFGKDSKLH